VRKDWAHPPVCLEVGACAVSVDTQDRVYCFNRNAEHPVVVLDRHGNFLPSWGAGMFSFLHAIRIDADDHLWLTDEYHGQFAEFTTDGRLLRTIGVNGRRSDTRVRTDNFAPSAWKELTHGGGPFKGQHPHPRRRAAGPLGRPDPLFSSRAGSGSTGTGTSMSSSRANGVGSGA
jgi:hypothetical protein